MSEANLTQQQTINFFLDDFSISVPKGTTVYEAAKKIGIEIPIFCYLDRMPPFGACRMCLVEVDHMPKLQTACTLEATEGMVVKTQSKIAAEGRKDILEFLLINHPLDCPICDRAGECPLQENTMKYGPGLSRFFETKRQFTKAIILSPVLVLDRERCISCARCTRFSDVISGDHALEFIERGYRTEVGTPHGERAESKFIGNTIMICPVGALTSNVYRFRARPWDNDSINTACTLCPVGCSMIVDSRDGEVMRTRSRENREINDIWMCDKGWFGYEFSSSTNRLTQPLMRQKGQLVPISWEDAINVVTRQIVDAKSNGKLAFFGGNPLTTEENDFLQQLAREGAGVTHIDHHIDPTLQDEFLLSGMEIKIGDCEKLSYIIVLGTDLTEEFPVIWLRLRQAINSGAKLIFFGHFAPEISPYCNEVILHSPGKELAILKENFTKFSDLAKTQQQGAIFVGKQYLNSLQRSEIISELFNFKKSYLNVSINLLEGQGNSFGAQLAHAFANEEDENFSNQNKRLRALDVLLQAAETGWDFLYVVGANPASKFSKNLWNKARKKLKFLVVQDLFLTETAQEADLILPSLSFLEKDGTFITIDGHEQHIQVTKDLPSGIYSDGFIFSLIAENLGLDLTVNRSIFKHLEKRRSELSFEQKPKSNSSIETNQKLEEGELYATFAASLFDEGMRMQNNPHLKKMVKPPVARLHPKEAGKLNLQDLEEIFVESEGNRISVVLKLDQKIAPSTIVLPLGFPEVPVQNLAFQLYNGLKVKISKNM